MNGSNADNIDHWEQVVTASEGKPDLAHLETPAQELKTILTEVRSLRIQQDAQKAIAQQTSQEIAKRMTEGKQLATRMRAGVRSVYGNKSEKLVEFGITPLRKRSRAAKPESPPEVTVKNDVN
ncbi:MAG TPA: hypothetical protein VMW27_12270 [Thermoanaerobaculia bacterium]|nr:hypothetical protein [Thermoanaerobaculia bacterium]